MLMWSSGPLSLVGIVTKTPLRGEESLSETRLEGISVT